MIIRAALLCFIMLACFNLPADVPGDNHYTEVSTEAFDKYFSFLYSKQEGGDLLLAFSPTFIKDFQSDGCLLLTSIEVFNAEGDITKWAQIAGMRLAHLSPEIAAQQQLYIGGLGYKLQIRFTAVPRKSC